MKGNAGNRRLLGTGSWDRIWEAIDTVKKGRKACFIDDVSHLYDQHTSRMRTTPTYSAYVKIGEGCNNGCSFCIILTFGENCTVVPLNRLWLKCSSWLPTV
mgnify:FL=1